MFPGGIERDQFFAKIDDGCQQNAPSKMFALNMSLTDYDMSDFSYKKGGVGKIKNAVLKKGRCHLFHTNETFPVYIFL